MASDHAVSTPPALRWVALFLALCAALGLWMGFKDQMRRNPPAWYTGGSEAAAPSAADASVREATPYDPNAKTAAPGQAAEKAPTPAEKKVQEDLEDAQETAEATTLATPADGAQPAPATTPGATPTTPRPKTAPQPPRPAPSEDPVGDILDGQRPATPPGESPPTVPY